MTIGGWLLTIVFWIVVAVIAFGLLCYFEDMGQHLGAMLAILVGIVCCFLIYLGMHWYFNNTASGQRALTDQKSELGGGIERAINVYTANGDLMASYEGKIDIEGNSGGYVLFDYQGHRYTYYNCFVESIAVIP